MSNTYLHKIQLIGNTGNTPKLRNTRDGVEVTNLQLAVQSPNKSAPTWYKLVFWRKQAEYVAARVGKGSQIFIEGEPEQRTWVDDNGVERHELVVHVREFQVLHRREVVGEAAAAHEVDVQVEESEAPAPAPESAPEPEPASLKKPRKKAAKKATAEAIAA